MVGLYVFPEQVSSLNASLFWPCSAVPFPSSRPAASSPGVFRTKIYTFPSPSSVAPCFQLVVSVSPKTAAGRCKMQLWGLPASPGSTCIPVALSLGVGDAKWRGKDISPQLSTVLVGESVVCRSRQSIGRWCQQHLFRPTVTSPPHLAPRASLIRSRPDLAASFLPPQQSVPAPSHKIPADFRSFIFFACTSL